MHPPSIPLLDTTPDLQYSPVTLNMYMLYLQVTNLVATYLINRTTRLIKFLGVLLFHLHRSQLLI